MGKLIYGSVCSGIAGEAVAWTPLGWKALWHAEIDPFCCEVLHHHYTEVSNFGDITQIETLPAVELLVGGTPCQSFSIIGKRQGLDDERGQLALHFCRVLGEVRPRWVIWENVPNALRTHGGRDFGTFLRTLEVRGYGWAYRVVDLQGFGLPQRRKRLFVVGYLGDWRPPAAILFPREEVAEAPAAADQAWRQNPARNRTADDWCYTIRGDKTPKVARDLAPTLCATQGGEGVVVWTAAGPRRLTPREWERLQGFPDNYTAVTFRGRPASDRQRRKSLGNAFPPPILAWIGARIQAWEGRILAWTARSASTLATLAGSGRCGALVGRTQEKPASATPGSRATMQD
jgi:DNA (cytosine-5)-methyltransferase 1